MPRVLGSSQGGGHFFLWAKYPCAHTFGLVRKGRTTCRVKMTSLCGGGAYMAALLVVHARKVCIFLSLALSHTHQHTHTRPLCLELRIRTVILDPAVEGRDPLEVFFSSGRQLLAVGWARWPWSAHMDHPRHLPLQGYLAHKNPPPHRTLQ